MALSISVPSGEACYLLEKALNGLRNVSLAWLQILTLTVWAFGFVGGFWIDCKNSHELEFSIYVLCVDENLLSTTKEAEERRDTEKRGSLTFISRVIKRERDL